MAREVFHIEGLKELETALAELPKATGKNVLRRVLRKRAQPIADAASGHATRRTGALAESFAVSTKLSRRQAAMHRAMFRDDKASVEMFVGAGPLPQAHLEEFGSLNNDPNPMLRPAWDSNKTALIEGLKDDLWDEIQKSAARLARKSARAAAK